MDLKCGEARAVKVSQAHVFHNQNDDTKGAFRACSSHAGAGRGPGRAAGAPRGYGGAVNRCPFE